MTSCFGGIYDKKKVFVTGHTGFKGSWLALWLQQLGAEVCGYALPPNTNPSHFQLLDLHMNSHLADVRDIDALKKAMGDFQPEVVFHLAAQPLVRLGYREPVETFETNVMGTINVFEACRETSSVKAIVNVTSDKCYENKEWIWGYRENDPKGGYDPYSASKGCAELVANSYLQSYFNPKDFGDKHDTLLASCRAGNVIGGGDWAEDRLFPDIMRATNAGQSVEIRNPSATRPWQHVLEPLSGYLCVGWKLLEGKPEFAGGWNFGPADEGNVSVGEIVAKSKHYWPEITDVMDQAAGNVHEAQLLHLDCSKASFFLRWQPIWRVDETTRRTVEWYKKHYGSNLLTSDRDIDAYVTDAEAMKVEWTTVGARNK